MYATEECRTAEPPLSGGSGVIENHRFACFHPVQHDVTKVAVEIRSAEDPVGEARAAELRARPPILEVDRLVKERWVTPSDAETLMLNFR